LDDNGGILPNSKYTSDLIVATGNISRPFAHFAITPMAKAIIIERGSVLSHSAVIAREIGITLVVGIRGLTKRIEDGMRIRVDGIRGTVEILEADDEKK